MLDAGPLIYLAKLEAFDVLDPSDPGAVTPAVNDEAARAELAYAHPEVVRIEGAMQAGRLVRIDIDDAERLAARQLAERVSGLHAGELEFLAVGLGRGWPVCLHERQASRLASALGVQSVHIVELLISGTKDMDQLERRIRGFARLTNLTAEDLDELIRLVHRRRP